MPFLWVALGGALGACLRHGLSLSLASVSGVFPLATLMANALGSFALGLLYGLVPAPHALRLFLGVGLLGGFTTYSTFNTETLRLLTSGEWLRGGTYSAATYLGCLLSGAAGMMLARSFQQPAS